MSLTLRTDSSMVAKANSLLEWSHTAHMVLWIGFRVAVNAPSRFASCDDLFSPFMISEGSRERNGPFCLFLFILTGDPLKLLEDFAITYFQYMQSRGMMQDLCKMYFPAMADSITVELSSIKQALWPLNRGLSWRNLQQKHHIFS